MDEEIKEIMQSVLEGTKAANNYTDAEAKAYWKGVEDCYKELSKICEGCFDSTINAVCVIDKNVREHERMLANDDF